MNSLSSDSCSLEVIELCRLNAQRLLEDSKRTSEPTRSALLELSLEECGKGIVVFFHLTKQKIFQLETSKTHNATFLEDSLVNIMAVFLGVDKHELSIIMEVDFLRETFKQHKFKLHAVKLWLTMLVRMAESFEPESTADYYETAKTRSSEALEHGSGFKLKDIKPQLTKEDIAGIREANQEWLYVLNSVDRNVLIKLDEVKKMGFFVDYDQRLHSFVFPNGLSKKDNDTLERLTEVLISELVTMRSWIAPLGKYENRVKH